MMKMQDVRVNVPDAIGKDAIDLVRMILDCDVKMLAYPDCTHPYESWQCDGCEDHARDCDCFGCSIICGSCSETVLGKDGRMISCQSAGPDTPVLTFKEAIKKRRDELVAMLDKDMVRRGIVSERPKPDPVVPSETRMIDELDAPEKAALFDEILRIFRIRNSSVRMCMSFIKEQNDDMNRMHDIVQSSASKIMEESVAGRSYITVLDRLISHLVETGYKIKKEERP